MVALLPDVSLLARWASAAVACLLDGLGLTMLPEMAIEAGILHGTDVVARPLKGDNTSREIALIWRTNSPREEEFKLLAEELRAG